MTSETPLIHLLHRASQIADTIFGDESKDLALTPRQYIVLSTISEHQGTSQTGVVLRTGIDRSTMADIILRLHHQGLLTRRRTKADARTYAVSLTAAGEAALKKGRDVSQRAEGRLFSLLSKQNQKALSTALAELTAPQPTE